MSTFKRRLLMAVVAVVLIFIVGGLWSFLANLGVPEPIDGVIATLIGFGPYFYFAIYHSKHDEGGG